MKPFALSRPRFCCEFLREFLARICVGRQDGSRAERAAQRRTAFVGYQSWKRGRFGQTVMQIYTLSWIRWAAEVWTVLRLCDRAGVDANLSTLVCLTWGRPKAAHLVMITLDA